MARIRTIKPEFFDSPDTATASYRGRLFYIALWCWADDYGVGSANGKALVGFAFPNDDEVAAKDFPSLRKEVADAFGVMFYKVDGRPFYCIPSWDKHQRTERKARRLNPPPPEGIAAGQGMCDGSSDDAQGTSDDSDGSSGLGTGEQGNRGTGEVTTLSAVADEADALDRFEEFWDAYDKKTGRKKAEAKYRLAIKKRGVAPDLLIHAATEYVKGRRAENKHPEFTKDPATWLNGEHWNDEIEDGPDDNPYRNLPVFS